MFIFHHMEVSSVMGVPEIIQNRTIVVLGIPNLRTRHFVGCLGVKPMSVAAEHLHKHTHTHTHSRALQGPPRKWQYMAASGRKSWLQGKGSKSKLSQFNAKARHVVLNSSLRCHQRISDLPSPMDPETSPLLYPWIHFVHFEHGELGVALRPCQIWIDRPVPMGWSALYQSLLTDHWGVHRGSPTMIWGFCKMGVILNHPFL